MQRRVIVFLVAILAALHLFAPGLTPVLADDDDDYEELDAFVEEVVTAANEFWDASFKQMGRRYSPPKLVEASVDDRIRSKCGNSRGADHSYCPAERTVYVDYDSDDIDSFVSRWDEDQSLVIVATIGHEWGHHVQELLGLFPDDEDDDVEHGIQVELQADCLMGAFIRSYARAVDWVARSDIRDVIQSTGEVGDDPDLPRREMTHGTPDERVAAFQTGYQSGDVRACGIP